MLVADQNRSGTNPVRINNHEKGIVSMLMFIYCGRVYYIETRDRDQEWTFQKRILQVHRVLTAQ